jgi:hypothetical protein
MLSAISIDAWGVIYQVAGYILIASLAIGLVATITTFMAGNRISSDLTTRLTVATQTAGEANVQAGAANERAAKIEQAAAWRIIPPDGKAALIYGLANGPGGVVTLSYSGNDPESLFLASQIEGTFKLANAQAGRSLWNVVVQPRIYSHAIYWDVRIFGQKDDVVHSIQASFSKARLNFLAEPIPNLINDSPGMMISGNAPTDATIFVGPKRPPN